MPFERVLAHIRVRFWLARMLQCVQRVAGISSSVGFALWLYAPAPSMRMRAWGRAAHTAHTCTHAAMLALQALQRTSRGILGAAEL